MHKEMTKISRLMAAISIAFLVSACQKSLESAAPSEVHASCDQRLKFATLVSVAVENPDGMTLEFTDASGVMIQTMTLQADKRHELPGTTPLESYWEDVPYVRFLKLEEGGQLLLSALPEKVGAYRAVAKLGALTREAQINVVADPCGHPVTQNIHFDIP